MAASGEGATISGYLSRCKRGKRHWKKRWFVIKGKVLYTYTANEVLCNLTSNSFLTGFPLLHSAVTSPQNLWELVLTDWVPGQLSLSEGLSHKPGWTSVTLLTNCSSLFDFLLVLLYTVSLSLGIYTQILQGNWQIFYRWHCNPFLVVRRILHFCKYKYDIYIYILLVSTGKDRRQSGEVRILLSVLACKLPLVAKEIGYKLKHFYVLFLFLVPFHILISSPLWIAAFTKVNAIQRVVMTDRFHKQKHKK